MGVEMNLILYTSITPWVVSNKMTHTHTRKKFQPWNSGEFLLDFKPHNACVICIHALSPAKMGIIYQYSLPLFSEFKQLQKSQNSYDGKLMFVSRDNWTSLILINIIDFRSQESSSLPPKTPFMLWMQLWSNLKVKFECNYTGAPTEIWQWVRHTPP